MAAGTTIKHKRKAGAFVGGDLAAGEVGIDTTNNVVYFSTDGVDIHSIGDATPIGSIIWFGDDSEPTDWLECDGSSLSTTTYADLFAVIGYTFGGSGSNFSLPDLRGEFIRGWDNGRGVDSSRAFGSAQSEEVGPHNHVVPAYGGATPRTITINTITSGSGHSVSQISNTNSGNENRPRNIALLPCIKYQ